MPVLIPMEIPVLMIPMEILVLMIPMEIPVLINMRIPVLMDMGLFDTIVTMTEATFTYKSLIL